MRLRAFVLITLLSTTACASRPATIVTPAGKTAFAADQVVLRINELENAAIAANAQGALDIRTTRTIVQYAIRADTILKTVPQGWQTSLRVAWQQTKASLPATLTPTVQAAVAAVDAVIATLVAP